MGHWTPKTKQKLCVYHFCVKFANFEILAVFVNTDKKLKMPRHSRRGSQIKKKTKQLWNKIWNQVCGYLFWQPGPNIHLGFSSLPFNSFSLSLHCILHWRLQCWKLGNGELISCCGSASAPPPSPFFTGESGNLAIWIPSPLGICTSLWIINCHCHCCWRAVYSNLLGGF